MARSGYKAIATRKVSAAIVQHEDTKAQPALPRWIARGMFATASTLSTTTIHAAGHRSKFAIECGTHSTAIVDTTTYAARNTKNVFHIQPATRFCSAPSVLRCR